MAESVYATVRPEDYAALRGVLGSHIPETHELWCRLLADLVGSQQALAVAVETVEIDPAEFAAACLRDEVTKDLHGLWRFAAEWKQRRRG